MSPTHDMQLHPHHRIDRSRPPSSSRDRTHSSFNNRCTLGAQANADGSAYLEQGQTRVLAVVSGPHEVERRGDALHDRALLECSLFHAPFAGFDRKRRRATDRGSLEMALAVNEEGGRERVCVCVCGCKCALCVKRAVAGRGERTAASCNGTPEGIRADHAGTPCKGWMVRPGPLQQRPRHS